MGMSKQWAVGASSLALNKKSCCESWGESIKHPRHSSALSMIAQDTYRGSQSDLEPLQFLVLFGAYTLWLNCSDLNSVQQNFPSFADARGNSTVQIGTLYVDSRYFYTSMTDQCSYNSRKSAAEQTVFACLE